MKKFLTFKNLLFIIAFCAIIIYGVSSLFIKFKASASKFQTIFLYKEFIQAIHFWIVPFITPFFILLIITILNRKLKIQKSIYILLFILLCIICGLLYLFISPPFRQCGGDECLGYLLTIPLWIISGIIWLLFLLHCLKKKIH